MHAVRRLAVACPRFYSTTSPVKPSVKLVAEIRKLIDGVSLTKAQEALSASKNDLEGAIEWLHADQAVYGTARAAQLAGRPARQGLIGVQVLSPGCLPGTGAVRAAMVELNCETDFVARNSLFDKLLSDIAHTAAFLAEPASGEQLMRPISIEVLNGAPLLDHANPQTSSSSKHVSVESAVRDLVAKVGEKISLKRAVAVAQDPFPAQQRHLGMRVFPYLHGSVEIPMNGTKGAMCLLALKSPQLPSLVGSEGFQRNLATLQRSLGRTIVGFPTTFVRSSPGESHSGSGALYDQPSDMFMFADKEGDTVEEELRIWSQKHGLVDRGAEDGGLQVLEFVKWSVAEHVE